MALDPAVLTDFRRRLKEAREKDRQSWELSRLLVKPSHVHGTLMRLVAAVRTSTLPDDLRDALIKSLRDGTADRVQGLPGELLRQLTGLSPTKAVRALCLLFGLLPEERPHAPVSSFTSALIEQFLRSSSNPYDLLLIADVVSLLDLGAGDLSFASELADQYMPRLQREGKELILHCVDRLRPGSRLGGRLQVDADRLHRLRAYPVPGLRFRFWGNQDMFALETAKGIWPRYTVVTCHAPATPTFAYEPRRVSGPLIEEHLRKTKGVFRRIRFEGEDALEVLHGGERLTFPAWKFEIRGPLALLDLMSRRGKLCLLSAVDTEVFWELLSQLLEDERVRPPDVIFTQSGLVNLFGDVYERLSGLKIGESAILSDLTDVRSALPRVLGDLGMHEPFYRFRYVEIRRGAVLEGLPSSSTARMFTNMTAESTPWFLILVPDH